MGPPNNPKKKDTNTSRRSSKTWALRGNSPYRIGVADRDAVQNASAVKHTRRRQTNHTNSMRAALGALSLATSVGWEYPPTTTCVVKALHLSALKGHAYSSLHGALKRCINHQVPRCGLLDEGYVYVRMIVALKKQNLPPEWTCSRPLPRGSSNGFMAPPVFWMTPMLNP